MKGRIDCIITSYFWYQKKIIKLGSEQTEGSTTNGNNKKAHTISIANLLNPKALFSLCFNAS